MEPQISIIVPVYNVADYLPKCIESILAQTFTDFELILINDGSPDKSPQICDHYASLDSRVHVIHKKNGGVSEARNCGLDIARGKYIGFADSDDWLAPDMFELLYNLSEKHDADISICGHYVVTDDSTEPLYEYFEGEIVYSNVEGVQKIVEDVEIQSYLWNKLFKRELFENLRFPVGKIYEDLWAMYFLFKNANKSVRVWDPKYYYLQRGGSITQVWDDNSFYNYYLAVIDRYNDLKSDGKNTPYHDISKQYLDNVVEYGFNYYNYYIKKGIKVNDERCEEFIAFLKSNINPFFQDNTLGFKNKMSISLLFFNKRLYAHLFKFAFVVLRNNKIG